MMNNIEQKVIEDRITAKQKVIGLKQVLRHITEKKLSVIYLASDADAHIFDVLQSTAKKHAIPIEQAFSKNVLGKICRIDVGAACVGILKEADK